MKYLVAYDGSNNSRLGLERTLGLYRDGDEIVVSSFIQRYYDVADPTVFSTADVSAIDEDMLKSAKESQAMLDELLKPINHKCLVETCDDVREAILTMAEKEKVDMIVVGSRGLSALSRFVLGSTSQYLVNHADVPVLVVPPGTTQHAPQNSDKKA
eukprot:CAMPEP_0119127944 /NCGR_PEP_ID=MMETSP1310-20130426/6290_1 /TAXON_ID=464262 /ORGANISM="Genus nov. species nov., Strain RCC2339" /LENGTH=155 /DNA_ID=CAMNT_0007118233 /DNA_START=127 /DNA_END=594 /DNA_ORIENTATION=+